MKTKIRTSVLFVVALLAFNSVSAGSDTNTGAILKEATSFGGSVTNDVRSLCWGMTLDQVRTAERHLVLSANSNPPGVPFETTAVGKDTVAGVDCGVAFMFSSNNLMAAAYVFEPNWQEWEKLRAGLVAKYGEPTVVDVPAYPAKMHFTVVSSGQGSIKLQWTTERSYISAQVRKGDKVLSLDADITYLSRSWKDSQKPENKL